MAAESALRYQSADERSYGKLAVDIADNHHYGGASTNMHEPLHWPPGAPVLFAVGYKLFGSDERRARRYDIRSAYWEQALITTGTTALAFALAWIARRAVGGRARGADRRHLSAADRRDRRPALRAARRVPADRRRSSRSRSRCKRERAVAGTPRAGALFGLAILTRTDLLPRAVPDRRPRRR